MPRKVFLLLMCVGFCGLAQALHGRYQLSRRDARGGDERIVAVLEFCLKYFKREGQLTPTMPGQPAQQLASTANPSGRFSPRTGSQPEPVTSESGRNTVSASELATAHEAGSAGGAAELQLAPPANFPDESAVRDSLVPLPIVGAWKDENRRIQFEADGQVVVQEVCQAGGASGPEIRQPSGVATQVLKGRFQAREDVLSVSWEDGPRTNYRWRLQDGWLLMTSHHGRNFLLHKNSENEGRSHAR